MTKHILEVDGYHVAERLLEGVMFQVHIEESSDNLTITDVTTKPEDQGYLDNINVAKFLPMIRKRVQGNIDHLKNVAAGKKQTLNELLDDCEVEYQGFVEPGETLARIDILEEV